MRILIDVFVIFISFFYWAFIVLLNKTLTVTVENDEAWEQESRVIFACWHQVTFVPFFHYSMQQIAMLVMGSVRGQILGWCARRLGFLTIEMHPEMSSYQNAKSITRFTRMLKNGHDGMIAVDGPLGPTFQVKPGIFYISKSTGYPIVPFGVTVSRGWNVKRWDHYLIPAPFSHVIIRFGKPYFPDQDDMTECQQLAEKISGLMIKKDKT